MLFIPSDTFVFIEVPLFLHFVEIDRALFVFISSVAGEGIDELKDALWVELNKEQNQVIEISHAPIDVKVSEYSEESDYSEDSEEEGTIYLNEVEEEWDLDKYKGIGWDN